jgi:hypothetical protein
MNRRDFVLAIGATLIAAPALARSTTDSIVAALRAEGYSEIDVSRTLLRRVRIVARSARRRREIVLNPRTGEILRDYTERFVDDHWESDFDDEDDDDDDDDDDDNSGPGGGDDDDDDDDDDD